MNLRIMNGRIGPESGHCIYKELSVVDYVLVSPNLLGEVLSVAVCNFNPMVSDVHNVLAVKFHRTLFTNHAQQLINTNSNLPGFSEENV